MTPPAAAAVHPRRTGAPAAPRPRRVSGPARVKPVPRPSRPLKRSARAETGVALGLLAALNRLSRHRLLDRLIAGRVWIGLVAFALIGIVTLQLGLLELNASIGRSLEHEGLLQRENAALSIENSELAAGDRVESRATVMGMELVPMGALRFLSARPQADALRAAAALRSPVKATGPGAGAGTGPGTGSGEAGAPLAATPGTSNAAAAAGEQTSAPSPGSAAGAQAPGVPAAEQATASGQATSSSESATASAGTASAAAPEPAAGQSTPPTPAASSAEASPAGGTQAGSTG